MKIVKYVILTIIAAIIVLISGYLLTMNFEAKIGEMQNDALANISKIDDSQKIVFLGDSITNGFLAQGGLSPDFQGYRGVIEDKLQFKDFETVNYAVGGYKVEDVQNQIDKDVSLNDTNKEILNHVENSDELKDTYLTSYDNDITIKNSIKNSDAIILTIGANDIIEKLLKFDENGEMSVDFSNIDGKLEKIRKAKEDLFASIKEINPDIQIYDVGIYFAFPHQGDMFMRMLYPVLIHVEGIIFIDDDKNGIHFVKIRDNMQSNIKAYVTNPNDIHPSESGHKVIANEILKEFGKYN